MTRPGLPQDWNERHKDTGGPALPPGVEFYSTPGHGYLRVDTRIHAVTLTDYDYQDGPHHVLLEEDCSAPAWLDEYDRKHATTEAEQDKARVNAFMSGLAQQIANKTGLSVSVQPAGIHAEPHHHAPDIDGHLEQQFEELTHVED